MTGTMILCLFLFSVGSHAQRYGFRHYGAEYGIPDGFIYTINQSSNGFLWIGTGNGIAKFDGFSYSRVSYPDSIQSRNPYVSFRDNNGTIWFGCNDGTVFYTTGEKINKLDLDNSRSIYQILQGPDSMLYIIPQGGSIFRLNISDPEKISDFNIPGEYNLFSAGFDDDGNLFAGAQGTIVVFRTNPDTIFVNNVIEGFEYSGVTSICNTGDYILAGTEDYGIFILDPSNNYKPERLTGINDLSALNVRSLYRDENGKIWVSTFGSGVIQLTITGKTITGAVHNYNVQSGLLSNDSRLVFQDSENNYWFGMFGEGLSMLVSDAFGFYTPGRNDVQNNIIFVKDYDGNFLLGTPAGYHIFNADLGHSLSFVSILTGTGNVEALSYYLDEQKRLWIGTNGNGLYVTEPGRSPRLFYRSGDTGSDEVRDIQTDSKYIWLGTTNGVIVLDKKSGREVSRFGTNESLPYNFIYKLLLDDGEVYIGTETDRLYKITKDLELESAGCQMSGSAKNKIVSFAKDVNGYIWTATEGNGIFVCYNDSVFSKTRVDGLFSNYCYSILSDSENNLWIGHEKGFSVIDGETGNSRSYGADYIPGGVCNAGGIFESEGGLIFIGTTSGVLIYNRGEDISADIPPLNNITSITINDKEYEIKPVINLPYSRYRITINYSGINFSDPEKVYYSTFLENFDTDWSPMSTDRKVTYNLADGKYRFNLMSVDEKGLSQPGASFVVQISKPFYKKWWFVVLTVIIIAALVFFIIREREKSHKKIQIYLEDELEKRTSLIVKQKGEIELQNLEITDSINYAKRIQSSILPDVNKLKENFREAFILFHPRDIVSGDFYWFDKIDDDKFIVVCADSTGHGVPGAFMSMIGSTLLQDIVTRKKITRPSQILSSLDKQIFSTLNQNVDLGVSNDGMDVVVCEFNIKTRHIRFASAMRPIILVISGESYYIKGNRSSVGGESVIDKYFDDQEYFLNEGDTIYLFSDGLPDQFGGVDGKKMKIARFKRLIDQVVKLPMREQESTVKKFFEEWKGSHEQVDDVLMMGIRM